MRYRPMGKTGCEVSVLGFGCMRLPCLGHPGQIDEKKASEVLFAALDHGVNYVDTAVTYHMGTSESFTGKALSGGRREKVYLATKLPSWEVKSPGDFEHFLKGQLERLQTDHIDFYLLHSLKREWWENLCSLGVASFLDRAKREGHIRHAGFSFHDEIEAFKEIVDGYDFDFCQIQYNYMDETRQAGREGLDYAYRKGLGVLVMEPLRGGKLAAPPPPDMARLFDGSPVKRSPAEWALRWIWNHPQVTTALSGMNEVSQVLENCSAADGMEPQSLTAQELEIIDQIRRCYQERMKIPCTGCGYCMPCPRGVHIPRIFSIYNDYHMYNDAFWSYVAYARATNSSQMASNCVECGQCEQSCPQAIGIRSMLKEAHTTLTGLIPPHIIAENESRMSQLLREKSGS